MRNALSQLTNLNFYTSTLAKRVILKNCKVATGVLANTAGVEYSISAKQEVILSAGAVSRFKHVPRAHSLSGGCLLNFSLLVSITTYGFEYWTYLYVG